MAEHFYFDFFPCLFDLITCHSDFSFFPLAILLRPTASMVGMNVSKTMPALDPEYHKRIRFTDGY